MGTISVHGEPSAAAQPGGPPEAVAEFLRLCVILTGLEEYGDAGYTFQGAGHLAGTHNLYLAGSGNMPAAGTPNPSLTMTALAGRS